MGILNVQVYKGTVIGVDKSGTSDPYLVFSWDGKKVYTTKECKKTLHPVWNECFLIHTYSLSKSKLEVQVMDWNKIEKSTVIGTATIPLDGLVPNQEKAIKLNVLSDGDKVVSTIELALTFDKKELLDMDEKDIVSYLNNLKIENAPSDKDIGILNVQVRKGRVIGVDTSGTSDPYLIFNLNGENVYKTKECKKTIEPEWNESFNINIRSLINDKFGIHVMDWNKIQKDKHIGTAIVPLNDLVSNQEKLVKSCAMTEEDKVVSILEVVLTFKPKNKAIETSLNEAASSTAEKGVLTVNVNKGRVIGVDTSGTSDPYLVFNLNGENVYKTTVCKKTIEPVWNDSFNVNINSLSKDKLEFQVMDWNKIEKHTFIGKATVPINGLIPDQDKLVKLTASLDGNDKVVSIVELVLNFKPTL